MVAVTLYSYNELEIAPFVFPWDQNFHSDTILSMIDYRITACARQDQIFSCTKSFPVELTTAVVSVTIYISIIHARASQATSVRYIQHALYQEVLLHE